MMNKLTYQNLIYAPMIYLLYSTFSSSNNLAYLELK